MHTITLANIYAIVRKPTFGKCVVCDAPTATKFHNQGGESEYVHNYHEEQYIGCKEVWRYWQDREHKVSRQDLEAATSYGDESAADLLSWGGEDEILDERDYYTPGDYHSYIQSREWKIKARACKQSVGFRCERCGFQADSSQSYKLHAHHKTYERLFREWRQDIEILCPDCHFEETKRRKDIKNG